MPIAQNAAMFPLLRSRPLIWLALFAWLAQLCLPAAHAAAMAGQHAGIATWCGDFSPAMAQKLAQLPDEVREILAKGAAHDSAPQDCIQFCASAAPGHAPAPQPGFALLTAEVEAPFTASESRAVRTVRLAPPARGPPLES